MFNKSRNESALSKKAVSILDSYGVNMQKVSDASVPFAERLKELQKIGKNTDALAAVFGAENIQAAQGLINTADAQAQLTEKITGTNVAYEQAEIVMSGWGEKMKRAKAWFEDLKIAGFGITKVLGVVGNVGGDVISVAGDMGAAYSGLAPVFRSTGKWLKETVMWKKLSVFWTKIATATQWAWNAAMSANPIGLVIAAIVALIALVVVAINKFDSWGSSMLLLLGPIGMVVSAVMMVKRHWDSIVNAFKSDGIIGGLKRIGVVLLDVLMHPLQRILGWVAKLTGWDWAKKAQNSLEEFRAKMELITPEEHAKSKVESSEVKTSVEENTKSFSPKTILGDKTKDENKSTKNTKVTSVGGSSNNSGHKTINFKVEMKNYFNIDRNIGSKEVVANNIVAKINDRLRDAVVSL
ncbi:MAG: hypothetical protein CSA38_01315 [Flavobacteriales bacterium]|nr:MAG: hypothetical protein CSA38_01315 [Flavobacteriales bacterium]